MGADRGIDSIYGGQVKRREIVTVAGAGLAFQLAASAQQRGTAGTGSFDVRTFRATGDGKTLDTAAINRAIDAAAAAGGGTVSFPAGTYATYSIRLKSRVSLYLGPGATI